MSTENSPGRLVSLDALRGFDMFWIVGGDALVAALCGLSASPAAKAVARQFEHKAWAGFAFEDLIFPLFVFIVGVTTVFSLSSLLAREGRSAAMKRVLRRAVLLLVLGIFYNGGLAQPWPEVRLAGVLSRIALAYAATGLLFCLWPRPRVLAAVAGGLLAGYWALLAFVPVRNVQLEDTALAARLGVAQPTVAQAREIFATETARVSGHYEPGLNLTNHLDFQYLPGALYNKYYDPEGLLSTLPAVATCLLGVLAGLWLRRGDVDDARRVRGLVIAGVAAVAAGWLWHLEFPVIKKLWTSSYVLVAGGYSALLLALFYHVVDVRKWRRWCEPFVWIGANPITLYLATAVVSFHGIGERLAGGSVRAWLDAAVTHGAGDVGIGLLEMTAVLALAQFLYRRKIFLRV